MTPDGAGNAAHVVPETGDDMPAADTLAVWLTDVHGFLNALDEPKAVNNMSQFISW